MKDKAFPGEVSLSTRGFDEKSAEVIVATAYELP